VLKEISADLNKKIGRGFLVHNLERTRNSNIFTEILKQYDDFFKIEEDIRVLPLSWTHYLFLMRIENEAERQFYGLIKKKSKAGKTNFGL